MWLLNIKGTTKDVVEFLCLVAVSPWGTLTSSKADMEGESSNFVLSTYLVIRPNRTNVTIALVKFFYIMFFYKEDQ